MEHTYSVISRYLVLTMPTRTPSPRRALWRRAFLSSVATMLVLMAVLFGAKYFSVQADSRVIAGSSNASDLAIESLSSKIVSRNQEHQRLQWKRAALSDSPKQPTSTLAPGERTRRALVSELIHLLALEKQYSEGSPEIASTREQIDALQAQIADLPQVDQHAQFARASTDDTAPCPVPEGARGTWPGRTARDRGAAGPVRDRDHGRGTVRPMSAVTSACGTH